MKFTTSEYLTIADLKSDEYKVVKEELKACKEKDFIDSICIYEVGNVGNKDILKIESIEIVKNNGQIIPWVKVIARDCFNFYAISMNYYNSSDNFTITYAMQK